MEINFSEIHPRDAYRLLVEAIVPRPIAWVSTVSKKGIPNLAPFSFYNGVCSNPPALLFCPTLNPEGEEKDTLRNIRATKDFVVNATTESLASQMNQTSAPYPYGVSEFEKTGLTPAKSHLVKAPRVAEATLSMECTLIKIFKIGSGLGSGFIVVGKVVYMHLSDEIYKDGQILVEKLKPVARLGGQDYVSVRDTFQLKRPRQV